MPLQVGYFRVLKLIHCNLSHEQRRSCDHINICKKEAVENITCIIIIMQIKNRKGIFSI